MISKNSLIYLLLLSVFIILSCTDTLPTPVMDHTPTPDTTVIVHANCHKDGFQTYVAMNGEYCFSYPAGYYVTEDSEPKDVELRYFNNTPSLNPSTEELEEIQSAEPLSIRLSITYQSVTTAGSLEKFAVLERGDEDDTEPIPWTLSNRRALIRKEIKDGLDGNGKEISYFVYTNSRLDK